ncbi:MAG TPA: hypothetical protein VLD37_02855 [Candidatus Bilamarchaeum sp.]|nr:hypothetical protein [Candidatus Bilamarchaeum sp.]
MTFFGTLFGRDPEAAARKEAMREFKRAMPGRGAFHELERSKLTEYYDRRFGQFEPELDRWKDGEADVLKSNPLLRRIDIIADSLFKAGFFELRGAGEVLSLSEPRTVQGTIAAISLMNRARTMTGMLTLDIGSEVHFSKLRLYADNTDGFIIRLSTLDHGMTVQPHLPERKGLPETVHERAAEGSEVFQTLSETLAGIERLLRGKVAL